MTPISADEHLDAVHHVAIAVDNIAESVDWYTSRLKCRVGYRDETWAMLEFANIRLALIAGKTHPPHIGLMKDNAADFGTLKPHRDGTRSVYLEDPSGNWVEILTEK